MEKKVLFGIFSFSVMMFGLIWFGLIVHQQTILIEQQANQLQVKEDTIDQLESQIRDLTSKITDQVEIITDLQQRLGLAQSEIESLKPVIKAYWAIGVKETGEGIVIPIEAKLTKGTGSISVNIKNVDMLAGTQDSVRAAVAAAARYTELSTAEKDIQISFINKEPEIVVIDGPSAGAAIALAIIAGLKNASLASDVLITGTIDSEGMIGQVGSVPNKIAAARAWGANQILVPAGQSVAISGIAVVEVRNIWDAVPYVLRF